MDCRYDYWYQPHHNVMISTEWGHPRCFMKGLDVEDVAAGNYGTHINVYDWQKRKLIQKIDLGMEGVMPLEIRFLHDPRSAQGFVGSALYANVFRFYKTGKGDWAAHKVIDIPAKKVEGWALPDMPAVLTDILMSMDDKYLYLSCWLHGDLRQYDVSDPMVLKEHLIEEWGDDVVVPITNWNTLQLRSLVKDISKFYKIPFAEVNSVTNKMVSEATPLAKKAHGITAGVYNPTFEELEESYLDMVVAGTEQAVLMVESEAKELNEDLMLGAVLFGHQEMQAVINACKELKEKAGKEDWIITPDEETPEYYAALQDKYTDQIKNAFTIKIKSERSEAISIIKEDIVNSYPEADDIQLGKILGAFKN